MLWWKSCHLLPIEQALKAPSKERGKASNQKLPTALHKNNCLSG